MPKHIWYARLMISGRGLMQSYDVIIAGGGMSGILAAINLAVTRKDLKVHLLESESFFGGRLRSTQREGNRWGFGLNVISADLVAHFADTIKELYPNWSMDDFSVSDCRKVAYCSGGKAHFLSYSDIFKTAGVKAMGGRNAAREWEEFEFRFPELVEKHPHESVSKGLDIKRSSASGIILSEVSKALGVPDIWHSPLELLKCKFDVTDVKVGKFDDLLDATVELLEKDGLISVSRHCRVFDVRKGDNGWVLHTENGLYNAQNVVVAYNPWAAVQTMTRETMPVAVANMALKSKPVSLVVLSTHIEAGEIDSDFILISSEAVQVVRLGSELSLQATIDYEMSLDAPEVVKAVKRLKRAVKKLPQYFNGLKLKGEFLGLVAEAWAIPTGAHDFKYIEKMVKLGNDGLYFVGDSYGKSYNGDANLVSSVAALKMKFNEKSTKIRDFSILEEANL
jgi:glycine/D-amino acid oxidase-like deaminating enzyme